MEIVLFSSVLRLNLITKLALLEHTYVRKHVLQSPEGNFKISGM